MTAEIPGFHHSSDIWPHWTSYYRLLHRGRQIEVIIDLAPYFLGCAFPQDLPETLFLKPRQNSLYVPWIKANQTSNWKQICMTSLPQHEYGPLTVSQGQESTASLSTNPQLITKATSTCLFPLYIRSSTFCLLQLAQVILPGLLVAHAFIVGTLQLVTPHCCRNTLVTDCSCPWPFCYSFWSLSVERWKAGPFYFFLYPFSLIKLWKDNFCQFLPLFKFTFNEVIGSSQRLVP